MNIAQRIQDINNRWNIPDDESYEQRFERFKQRILNSFTDIDSYVSDEDVSAFCIIMGIKEEWEDHIYVKRGTNIFNALQNEIDPKKFFRLIEVIFMLPTMKNNYRENLIGKTKLACELSEIGVNINVSNGVVQLYPSGEALLDQGVVNRALSFLNANENQHFVDALKFYQENTSKSRIKSSESLRRSLEEFLRTKLKNQKGLKSNIAELGECLDTQSNNDLRKLVTQTLSILDHPFFNNNSKHNDGLISEAENEFLIYQIALLMRYVDQMIQ